MYAYRFYFLQADGSRTVKLRMSPPIIFSHKEH